MCSSFSTESDLQQPNKTPESVPVPKCQDLVKWVEELRFKLRAEGGPDDLCQIQTLTPLQREVCPQSPVDWMG